VGLLFSATERRNYTPLRHEMLTAIFAGIISGDAED